MYIQLSTVCNLYTYKGYTNLLYYIQYNNIVIYSIIYCVIVHIYIYCVILSLKAINVHLDVIFSTIYKSHFREISHNV